MGSSNRAHPTHRKPRRTKNPSESALPILTLSRLGRSASGRTALVRPRLTTAAVCARSRTGSCRSPPGWPGPVVLPTRGGTNYVSQRIHASATIGRPDHTFGFSFIEQHDELAAFVPGATAEIAAVQASEGLRLNETTGRPDVIHFSAIPWVRFTGLTHARSFGHPDSCPKISVGQTYVEGAATLLPVSINVHHGLADGYHVGQFLAAFQEQLG